MLETSLKSVSEQTREGTVPVLFVSSGFFVDVEGSASDSEFSSAARSRPSLNWGLHGRLL